MGAWGRGGTVRAAMVLAVLVVAGTVWVAPSPVRAATITVNSNADVDPPVSGDGCTLREAIANANDDAQTYPDCEAGSDADTISVNASPIALTASLPVITSQITINGSTFMGTQATISGAGCTRR